MQLNKFILDEIENDMIRYEEKLNHEEFIVPMRGYII